MKLQRKAKYLTESGLSELVYTVAMAAPVSVRRRLPERLFKATNSARTAKKFAIKGTPEQKREFLGYLGFSTHLVISDGSTMWAPEFSEALKKVQKKQDEFDVSGIGVYVTSDKKFVSLLESMATLSGSKAYGMSLELVRAKFNSKSWPIKLNSPDIKEVDDKEAEYQSFVKLTMAIDETIQRRELSSRLNPNELRILLFLFLNKNNYVEQSKIDARFVGMISKLELTSSIKELAEQLFIQKHVDWHKKEYTITARGILFVSEILNHAAKLFNFNQ